MHKTAEEVAIKNHMKKAEKSLVAAGSICKGLLRKRDVSISKQKVLEMDRLIHKILRDISLVGNLKSLVDWSDPDLKQDSEV